MAFLLLLATFCATSSAMEAGANKGTTGLIHSAEVLEDHLNQALEQVDLERAGSGDGSGDLNPLPPGHFRFGQQDTCGGKPPMARVDGSTTIPDKLKGECVTVIVETVAGDKLEFNVIAGGTLPAGDGLAPPTFNRPVEKWDFSGTGYCGLGDDKQDGVKDLQLLTDGKLACAAHDVCVWAHANDATLRPAYGLALEEGLQKSKAACKAKNFQDSCETDTGTWKDALSKVVAETKKLMCESWVGAKMVAEQANTLVACATDASKRKELLILGDPLCGVELFNAEGAFGFGPACKAVKDKREENCK